MDERAIRNTTRLFVICGVAFVVAYLVGAGIAAVVPDNTWAAWRVGLISGFVTFGVTFIIGGFIWLVETFM